MPHIKLMRIYDRAVDYDSYATLGAGVTDWEWVSDEEFAFIKANMSTLTRAFPEGQVAIVEQVADGVDYAKMTIKEIIGKQAKEMAALAAKRDEQKAAEKLKREAAKKRKVEKEDSDD